MSQLHLHTESLEGMDLNDLFNCLCSLPQIDVYVPVIFIWLVFLSSLSFGLVVPCAVTQSRLMEKKG